jgi:hypothetical protein
MTWFYSRNQHRLYAVSIIGRVVYARNLGELKNKLRGMHGQQTSQITLCGRQ